MARPAPRRTPPSGSVLLWDRRHREAARALAAQLAAKRPHEAPSPAEGGGGEPDRAGRGSSGGRA